MIDKFEIMKSIVSIIDRLPKSQETTDLSLLLCELRLAKSITVKFGDSAYNVPNLRNKTLVNMSGGISKLVNNEEVLWQITF